MPPFIRTDMPCHASKESPLLGHRLLNAPGEAVVRGVLKELGLLTYQVELQLIQASCSSPILLILLMRQNRRKSNLALQFRFGLHRS